MSGLSLINEALVRIGVPPVASFDDLSAQAMSATHLYEETRDRCLSEHPWSFSMKEVLLSELVLPEGVPPVFSQFSSVFQLPSDMVRILGFWNRAPYMVAGQHLFADVSEPLLLYIHRSDPSVWSPPFKKWVVLELAAAFAITLTDNERRAAMFYEEASQQRRTSKSLDSQQVPSYVFDMLKIYAQSQGNYLGA